jgi:transcriptional regulator
VSTRDESVAPLQGTLGLLILRTLTYGDEHGQGIARAIQTQADGALLVDRGSLYRSLPRLERCDWIEVEWGTSHTNRKTRLYRRPRAGRTLTAGTKHWHRLSDAIARILGPLGA